MNWGAAAAVLLALAVALGAFGAHTLRTRLDAYSMGLWERAVFYHLIHALGLLIVSKWPATTLVSALLLAGIVLFSGSLYLLALTGVRTLGMVTPLGGLSFIAAWIVLAVSLARKG